MRDSARELIKPRPEPTIVVSPEVVRVTGHVILVAAVAAIGGFLFGFDTAVINGAVGSVQTYYHVGTVVLGLAVSSALIGSAVGALAAGRLADRYGRIAALFFVIRFIRETRARELESISHQQEESLLIAS